MIGIFDKAIMNGEVVTTVTVNLSQNSSPLVLVFPSPNEACDWYSNFTSLPIEEAQKEVAGCFNKMFNVDVSKTE